MTQSDLYKATNEVNRVADQVGADHSRDVIRMILAGQTDAPLDVTAKTVPAALESTDSVGEGSASLGPNQTVEEVLDAEGAERLVGRVKRSKDAYTVRIRWKSQGGTTLFTDTVAASVTGTVDVDEKAIAPKAEVVITDESGTTGEATYSVQLR